VTGWETIAAVLDRVGVQHPEGFTHPIVFLACPTCGPWIGCGKLSIMSFRRSAVTPDDGKGWFAGPWNSTLPVAVGWADRGVNQMHRHDQMAEIYLVARGESTAVVAGEAVRLVPGDMLAVEPGEAHTFIDSSDDYLHFVVQAPFVTGDKVDLDG
jgi:mannose-6-phosphate isomerase-like protein (cupin superfamily)